MSGEAAFVRTWSVGRFRATLSCRRPRPAEALAAVIEWDPEIPSKLTPDERTEYREGLASAMRDLTERFRLAR